MTSDAMQALYEGDVERARALLAPDGELSVFDAAAFGRVERLQELLAREPGLRDPCPTTASPHFTWPCSRSKPRQRRS